MEYNIDYEKRLTDLLGFTILEKDSSNRWNISDGNNIIGYIQYKKLKSKDVKKNIPAKYGYHTEIVTDNFKFIKNRLENNNLDSSYEFQFNDMNADLNLDGNTSLENICSMTISSNEYGYISFALSEYSMNFEYKRQTDNFNIEEVVQIRSYNNDEAIIYAINFTNKDVDVQFGIKDIDNYTIEIKKTGNDSLNVSLLAFKDHNLLNKEEYVVKGNISEALKDLELAKLSFNYLRSFLREILPFKEDIILYMFNNLKIDNENLLYMIEDEGLTRKRS